MCVSSEQTTDATPEEIFLHYRIGLAGSKNRGILCEHFEELADRSRMLVQNNLLSTPQGGRVVVSTAELGPKDAFGNQVEVMVFVRTLCREFPDLWSMGFDWVTCWDCKKQYCGPRSHRYLPAPTFID